MHILTRAEVLELRKLSDRSERTSKKLYLVEGEKIVKEALGSASVQQIIVTEEYIQSSLNRNSIIDQNKELWCIISSEGMKQLSAVITPPGIIAVVAQPTVAFEDIVTEKIACFLDVADPGNLGTMLRTADWFGVHHFIVTSQSVDPYNDKVIRASMGSLFRSTIYQSEDIHKDLLTLKDRGILLISTDSHGSSQSLPESTPWCVIMGSESHGTPPAVLREANYIYTIPSHGKTESLNVAVSFAITLFSLVK